MRICINLKIHDVIIRKASKMKETISISEFLKFQKLVKDKYIDYKMTKVGKCSIQNIYIYI